jgi:beta-lactam-binding protein with PASTA domain
MSHATRRRIGFAAALCLALVALVLSGCGPSVPRVVGMRQADAIRTLEEAGYTLGNTSAVATDFVEVGEIAAQNPAAGASLKKGKPVSLAINFNNGIDAVVPNVIGLKEVTAVNVAETTLLVPLVTKQYSQDVSTGVVAAQSPAAESQVKSGDTLVIVVSKGKAPAMVTVAGVVGKSQADAESAIEKADFKVKAVKVYDSKVAKGKVIAQLPEAGSSAVKGTTVQIGVSLGKGTVATTVPSVTRKSQPDANKAISSAGLKAKVIQQYSDSVKSGVVSAQFPSGGAEAVSGSQVLIVVSLGKEPSVLILVPDIMGMSESEAVSAVQAAGLAATVKRMASATVPSGAVGYQFPEAGASAPPGSSVLIAVSKGSE